MNNSLSMYLDPRFNSPAGSNALGGPDNLLSGCAPRTGSESCLSVDRARQGQAPRFLWPEATRTTSCPGHRVLTALLASAVLGLSPVIAQAQTTSPDTTTTAVTPAPLTVPTSVKPSATTPAVAPTQSAITQADIRDIRGPKPVPVSPLFYIALACLAVAAAVAAWMGYDWWKNRPRTPAQIALARLQKARALMEAGMAREFSIEVSEIIRSYIETRFHVFAMNRTTEEFLHDLLLPSDALLKDHQDLLSDFLGHCDLVKFARWDLSTEEMTNLHRSASDFVTHTAKPAPAAKETAAPPQKPQPESTLINA